MASKKKKTPKYLYHFTDEKGKEAILESGIIRASTDVVRDCMLGKGTYLTAMPPGTPTEELLENNWDGNAGGKEDKLEYAFRFKSRKLKHLKKNDKDERDVYVYPGDIDVYKPGVRLMERSPNRFAPNS